MIKKIEDMNKEELEDVIFALNNYISLYGNKKNKIKDQAETKTSSSKSDDDNFGAIIGSGVILGTLCMILDFFKESDSSFKSFLIGSSIILFSVLLDYAVSKSEDENKVYKDSDEIKNNVKNKFPKNLK